MKRNYIKPEIMDIPMLLIDPITGSMSTDMQLSKENDFDDDDFMSSFRRAKNSMPLDEYYTFNDDLENEN